MIRVELESSVLDQAGMVVDYAELGEFFKWVEDRFDHRVVTLGDGPDELNSTAENMAEVLYWQARELYGPIVKRVGVSETPKTWAYYYE